MCQSRDANIGRTCVVRVPSRLDPGWARAGRSSRSDAPLRDALLRRRQRSECAQLRQPRLRVRLFLLRQIHNVFYVCTVLISALASALQCINWMECTYQLLELLRFRVRSPDKIRQGDGLRVEGFAWVVLQVDRARLPHARNLCRGCQRCRRCRT